ncbi:MAG: hypothetical protein ACYCVY_13440, partial [Acidiferrobacteraceae bacterium]
MSILHEIATKIHNMFHEIDATVAPDLASLLAEEHKFREAVATEVDKVRTDCETEIAALKQRL